MNIKIKQEPQQPLILRAHRLMEAFAKSDDERDFYIDRSEGYIIFVDLDKPQADVDSLENELKKHPERYCLVPKLTFYETKKFMEGFVNEKIYDIDTKEKLLDIIQSKEARTTFLEFLSDHHAEQEKWQQYYQERSRIRIIDWLRQNHFYFVFEEDLDFSRSLLEGLKQSLFSTKVNKDILTARKLLSAKAKLYYSTEALNPRPKRGRPPKQLAKQEIEPQITSDIYLSVPAVVRPFLFIPEILTVSSLTFSADFAKPVSVYPTKAVSPLDRKSASLLDNLGKWDEEDEEEEEEKLERVVKPAAKQKEAPKLKTPPIKQPVVAKKPPSKPAPAKPQKAPPPPAKGKAPQKAKGAVAKPSAPVRSILKANPKAAPGASSKKSRRKRIMPVNKR